MQISLSGVKIQKIEKEKVLELEQSLENLMKGSLYEFEQTLHDFFIDLYNEVAEQLIKSVAESEAFLEAQIDKASTLGLKHLERRKTSVRLRTGGKVEYESLYAKAVPAGYKGSRHLSSIIWESEVIGSPMYKSINCLYSVLCPSFKVAKELLNYQGIEANYERTRQTSLTLATKCMENRSEVQLSQGESLSGKRVVVAIDGGRSRTRVYQDGLSGREEKYDTPWREPKLFAISTIDEQGKVNKERKPIYDGSFGDDETFDLLKEYLEKLEINKAQSVQILADGAPWIWNRARCMLLDLGVEKEKIIETLDYYHAAEHLHDMKEYLDKDKQTSHFGKLKNALWKGGFYQMTNLIIQGISNVNLEEFKPYKYFKKHKHRINYQALREQNRPCGSGIIESGIRRIINLRFKSPSTFWYPDNLEKLVLMRAIALSGRWEIAMKNLFTNT